MLVFKAFCCNVASLIVLLITSLILTLLYKDFLNKKALVMKARYTFGT